MPLRTDETIPHVRDRRRCIAAILVVLIFCVRAHAATLNAKVILGGLPVTGWSYALWSGDQFIRAGTTGAEGKIHLEDLLPGDYRISGRHPDGLSCAPVEGRFCIGEQSSDAFTIEIRGLPGYFTCIQPGPFSLRYWLRYQWHRLYPPTRVLHYARTAVVIGESGTPIGPVWVIETNCRHCEPRRAEEGEFSLVGIEGKTIRLWGDQLPARTYQLPPPIWHTQEEVKRLEIHDLPALRIEPFHQCGLDGCSATRGNIAGTVRDENGLPIKNALVWLEGMFFPETRITDEQGCFSFDCVEAFYYRIGLGRDGQVARQDIEVTPGAATNVLLQTKELQTILTSSP